MKTVFIACSLIFCNLLYATSESVIRELIKEDPLKAITEIEKMKYSDEKYSLFYLAESAIAQKCDGAFYYGGKIAIKGPSGRAPNPFEKYLVANASHFRSASEGMYAISANDFWIRKIKNRFHPTVGEFQFSLIYDFDMAVWDDGDGSMHTEELRNDYTNWMKAFPNHRKISVAKDRIKFMQQWSLKD